MTSRMQCRSFYQSSCQYRVRHGDRARGGAYLLQRVALEYALSSQDVDEDGHQLLEEGGVNRAARVMI